MQPKKIAEFLTLSIRWTIAKLLNTTDVAFFWRKKTFNENEIDSRFEFFFFLFEIYIFIVPDEFILYM